jgi:hypothetical protein
MSTLQTGFPDWQRITQWFGSPLDSATAFAIGAGAKVVGPLDVSNFASIVVCVKPTGGTVTVTVEQQVPGGPAGLKVATSFVANDGNVIFEAFVLLAGAAKVTFQGSAAGETLDYAIVPSNTNTNAEVAALTQLGFQHNDAVVANETAIDLEDTTSLVWSLVNDPANLRMKVAAQVSRLDYLYLAQQKYIAGATLVDSSPALVYADTSGGPFTINLPPAVTDGSIFIFVDYLVTWGANNLTIGRNGKNIDFAAANKVLNAGGSKYALVYQAATSNWRTLFEHV